MHPAFSVIYFTTASGAGYGAWIWLGLLAASGQLPGRTAALLALALGFIGVASGLLSSTLHLGKPLRAWRSFSQWRSSWLSREGVLAVLGFVPMLWLAAALWFGGNARLPGALLTVFSLATVICTAMIYISLKPIPAWRHPLVMPVYLLLSLFTGGLLLATVIALMGGAVGNMVGLAAIVAAFVLWRFKRQTWLFVDSGKLPTTRTSALGLAPERRVHVFERPHTEANYLNTEMGYVLARRHAAKLRLIALLLMCALPALLMLPLWLFVHLDAAPWLLGALLSALAGAVVERWLFFAEARHVVNLYY